MPSALGIIVLIKAQSAACAARLVDWSILMILDFHVLFCMELFWASPRRTWWQVDEVSESQKDFIMICQGTWKGKYNILQIELNMNEYVTTLMILLY
jgi:hypothetical protein